MNCPNCNLPIDQCQKVSPELCPWAHIYDTLIKKFVSIRFISSIKMKIEFDHDSNIFSIIDVKNKITIYSQNGMISKEKLDSILSLKWCR